MFTVDVKVDDGKNLFLFFSICANGTWDCGNIDCAKKVVCPHNQVFRRNITNCGATCDSLDLPGEYCKKDELLFDGCGCPSGMVMLSNVSLFVAYWLSNRTTFML